MIKKDFKRKIKEILRCKIDKNNRSRLLNEKFTIISSNCIGGMIYHDLRLQFLSPTINLYLSPADFIKFNQNIDYYLSCELTELSCDEGYPLGLCGDVVLHFVHYNTFSEANLKWKERKRRVNLQNLYLIMVDRDGCTEKEKREFDNLPCKNKVLFTDKNRPDLKSSFYIPGTSDGNQVIDLCQYKSKLSIKRWIDEFDYVSFLNQR